MTAKLVDVPAPIRSAAPLSRMAGLLAIVTLGVCMFVLLPASLSLFGLLQVTVYLIFAMLALSLGFVFGFGGILCLGQAMFFGIGAYTYAVVAINMGSTTLPAVAAIIMAGLFALALGYFIFFGRITDVYVGVITLTTSLILFSLMNSTAGPEYHVGKALLGGINGIPAVPALEWPLHPGELLSPIDLFRLTVICLLGCYFGLYWLLRTRFGRVVVAVRENERRAEMLGYDARLIKLTVFVIGAMIAGLAGVLHANWGSFVNPTVFGVMQSAQVLVWVMVGGSTTLLGPIVGCVLLMWFTSLLGNQQYVNASILLGATLVAFVMLLPAGLLPNLLKLGQRILDSARRDGSV